MTRKISEWIRVTVKYITEDIWHIPLGDLPKRKSFIIREIRILVLAFKGFSEDKVQLRASALTFNTLLSIVPIVAMAFGIAKSFGFETMLENEIRSSFEGQQQVMQFVLDIAREALKNTSGGFIAGMGMIILFWSVMQVLNHIEKSFNHIWQIKKSRPWVRKFTDYLSIMILAPLFLVISGSATVYISSQITNISEQEVVLHTIQPAIVFLLRFTPFFMMWLVLTLLYMVMPNTRVRFRSALVAGVIAGTLFQLTQLLYINFQTHMTNVSKIYGGFAAFPLFIIWMQISWLIVLMGAEISFANQNVNKYEFESKSLDVSSYQKRILTLMILNIIIKRFVKGESPASANDITRLIQIPVRIAREILYVLNTSGLITEILTDNQRERLYQPSIDIKNLNIGYVLSKIDKTGSEDVPVLKNAEYKKIIALITDFEKKIENSESNILVGEI